MEENKSVFDSQPADLESKPRSPKKLIFISIFCLLIVTVAIAAFMLSPKNTSQTTTNSPVVTQTVSVPPSPMPSTDSQTSSKNWTVYSPTNYTFVSPDKSFSFVYPTGWSYETIDGIIPQQQHIVSLGEKRTASERQTLAQQAGVPLTDTLAGISYTSQDITLYYTDTPEFKVTKLEDLATGEILSKKQIMVGKIPALEVTVDCPTECTEILFTKNQATFTFVQAKPRGDSAPFDKTKLTQIISTFTFLK